VPLDDLFHRDGSGVQAKRTWVIAPDTARRELPRPAFEALLATLSDEGKALPAMEPQESLWQGSEARPA
jgi:hypothetical protein